MILQSRPALAERILDLSFWPADQSDLMLGGLWEFHSQKLLQPEERLAPSEILVDISHPWQAFRPAPNAPDSGLQQASYAMLIRGLTPRPQGYSIYVQSPQPGTRLIAAPKYSPNDKRESRAIAWRGFLALLPHFLPEPLRLTFVPRALDEVWLLIVQRSTSPNEKASSIPRLSVAGGSRVFHLEN